MTKRHTMAAPDSADKVVDIAKRAQSNTDITKGHLESAKMTLVEKRYERAVIDEPAGSAAGKSNSITEDPWNSLAAEGKIIEPPFDLLTLSMLREQSSELGQCIDAMTANIDQLGHRQVTRVKLTDPKEKVPTNLLDDIKREQVRLSNFFEYCTSESFTQFRSKLRHDLESTGNYYFEVVRNAAGGLQRFQHLPAHQMRLSRMDDDSIEIERPILEMAEEDYSVNVVTVKEHRRFRRYVQGRSFSKGAGGSNTTANNRIWFKSFGDPRDVNKDTGDYASVENPVPLDKLATEVIHMAIYCPRSPYGLPRYIGNLLSIFGDRAAEEINYTTFRNNNVPSMLILVSGGQLTQGTVDRLNTFVESQIQNSDNRSKFVIVEAESVADEGEDAGQVNLKVEPLVKNQHNDALFQNYSEKSQDKIRRAFRLPPLLVGRAEDYTRTTAETSKRVADEQVFTPERNEFDALFNRIIYPVMGVRYHRFKSNTPSTTDNESMVKILSGAEKTGGLTPKIARSILEEVLSRDLGGFPEDFESEVPFSVTMAEAVKNMANAAEPGQQVTAIKVLKVLKALIGDDNIPDSIPEGEDPMLYVMKVMNQNVEESWQKEVKGDDE